MQDGKLAEVLTWLVVSSSLHYRRVVHRLSCPYTANDVVFSVIPRHWFAGGNIGPKRVIDTSKAIWNCSNPGPRKKTVSSMSFSSMGLQSMSLTFKLKVWTGSRFGVLNDARLWNDRIFGCLRIREWTSCYILNIICTRYQLWVKLFYLTVSQHFYYATVSDRVYRQQWQEGCLEAWKMERYTDASRFYCWKLEEHDWLSTSVGGRKPVKPVARPCVIQVEWWCVSCGGSD